MWLIPALPLAGFLVLLVAGRRLGEPAAGWLATLMCFGSFVASVVVYFGLLDRPEAERQEVQTLYEWIPAGSLQVELGFLADPLSITMALFVTGVGTLIHLYSIGYMHGDPGFHRFFVYMNLFVFSMLMLVLGSNLLVTFLGWEGVGACSYWLISFWFTDEANASAGKKAFITNRVGDWGFMVAMLLAFASVGSLDYAVLTASAGDIAAVTATGIALLLFVGAIGKSAQLPLFLWLPDAMAGPTPVSALIHAATMVTAGVFVMTRVNPILAAGYEWAPDVIAWVGAVTALFAALIAVAQTDIKRVLAYSTISQLGYMFLAVGMGAYVAAMFHMVTHAFFKALLFLGAGSVMHGMAGRQDIRGMGGLRKFMPLTAATFIVGWLAIAGIPPFAGFWSKDEILLFASEQNDALWIIGLIAAIVTGYYMSRLVFTVFFGKQRFATVDASVSAAASSHSSRTDDTEEGEAHAGEAEAGASTEQAIPPPHESPWLMTVPLVALAALSLVGGGLRLPFADNLQFMDNWLHPVVSTSEAEIDVGTGAEVALSAIAVVVALVGITAAAIVYLRRGVRPGTRRVEPELLARGFYYDGAVTAFVGGPGEELFEDVAAFDRNVVDGAVDGVATSVGVVGRTLRRVQSGFVRSYALGIATGVVILLAYFVITSFYL